MKTGFIRLTCFLTALVALATVAHGQGTAFTYQGRLSSGTNVANGSYDLGFVVCSGDSGINFVSGIIVNTNTPVSNGLFNVALDFGAGIFDGSARWLQIFLRTNGAGEFTTFSPRQPITATPYATRAANFSGAVSDSQLSTNVARLNANQNFSGAVNFSSLSNRYAGSFTGNGAGITNVEIGGINSLGSIQPAPGVLLSLRHRWSASPVFLPALLSPPT